VDFVKQVKQVIMVYRDDDLKYSLHQELANMDMVVKKLFAKVQNTSTFHSKTLSRTGTFSGQDNNLSPQDQMMRMGVLNEILQSERSYVADLDLIVTQFLNPLKKMNILNSTELDLIFSNILMITSINKDVLNQLEIDLKESNSLETMQIGYSFLKVVEQLKAYSTYATTQQKSIDTFVQIKKDRAEFASFIDTIESSPKARGINLLGYLIKPVQRICKYPLLFKELLKYTTPNNPDYRSINECFVKTTEITNFVNEKQRNSENLQKMAYVNEVLINEEKKYKSFSVFAPARHYVSEGTFGKINNYGKEQERHFFLFSDSLIYCKLGAKRKGNQTYVFKRNCLFRQM